MSAVAFTDLIPNAGDSLQTLIAKLTDCKRTRVATALSSAARTTTTDSATITNHDCRGVMAFHNITAIPGAQTLQLRIMAVDPISSIQHFLDNSPLTRGSASLYLSQWLPASCTQDLNTLIYYNNTQIPRTFQFRVVHSGAGSWTYSLAYCLIP